MVGIFSPIVHVGFMLFCLLMGWLGLRDWRSTRRRRGVLAMVVFGAGFILTGITVTSIVMQYWRLHSLSTANLEWAEIDGKRITDQTALDPLISSLSHAQFFEGRNIGAHWVLLRIKLATGDEYRYEVAMRVHGDGALISFGESAMTRGMLGTAGRFYTRDLPDVLEALGSPLPRQEDR
jgi:hypothetical protein